MKPQFISAERFKAFMAHKLHTDQDCNCNENTKIIRNECSPPVLHVPDLTSLLQEKVFAIDHIAETIFLGLDDIEILLDCRLISWRWANLAVKALQKLVTIKFYPSFKPPPEIPDPAHFYYWWNLKRPIRDLVEVMNNSHEFPCSSLSFRMFRNTSADIVTQPLEPLFMRHAARIQKLHIEGEISCDDLTQLVCVLALNVKELLVGALGIWTEESQAKVEPELQFEAEEEYVRTVLLMDTTAILNGRGIVWKNLSVFQSSSIIPHSLIHQIVESSPNLIEVFVDQQNLQCLVQPTNRIHLVKRLKISFYDSNTDSLELVANNHKNNWAVEEIVIFGCAGNNEQLEKIVDILGKILGGCSATCRKLVWHSTFKNFRIPQMHGLKHLTFQYEEQHGTGVPYKLFPEGTSLTDAFPNLNSLRIYSRVEMANVCVVNIFGPGDHLLYFPNVKKVRLEFPTFHESLQTSIQRMFPNATVRTYDIAHGNCFEK